MNAQASALLVELWSRLWAGGISDPFIAIEQISYLMALKRLSLDAEETKAGAVGLPEALRWERLGPLSDRELVARLESSLIEALGLALGPAFAATMKEARFAINDPELLRSCLGLVDQLGLERYDQAFQGELYEELLEQMQHSGRGGELRTPPAVAQAMVELVDPKPGERICDPAAGTGGLLLAAARHAADAARPLEGAELYGFDINPGMARLGVFNLFFHGVRGARFEQADALSPNFDPGQFDVVLNCPPFGALRDDREVDPKLSDAGTRSELLFLERCRQMQRGKAAILIPESALFGKQGAYVRVRREWLKRRSVQAVVLLPPDLLGFTKIRTAILFASNEGVTKEVWFCPIAEERSRAGTEPGSPGAEAQLSGLAEALRARRTGNEARGEAARALSERMFSASFAQIKNHNWSLSPALYREPEEVGEAEQDPLEALEAVEQAEAEIGGLLGEARRLLEETR